MSEHTFVLDQNGQPVSEEDRLSYFRTLVERIQTFDSVSRVDERLTALYPSLVGVRWTVDGAVPILAEDGCQCTCGFVGCVSASSDSV